MLNDNQLLCDINSGICSIESDSTSMAFKVEAKGTVLKNNRKSIIFFTFATSKEELR